MLARLRSTPIATICCLVIVPAALGQTVAPKKIHELRGHAAGPLTAAYSPDSNAILTISHGSKQAELRRWDATSGQELGPWKKEWTDVRRMLFSPDGRLLAVVVSGGNLTLIDTATRADVRSWTLPKSDAMLRLTFSPDASKIGATFGNKLHLWDCATGAKSQEVALCDEPGTAFAGFMPDGRTLVTYFSHGRPIKQGIRLFDLQAGVPGRELDRPRGLTAEVVVSPTGRSVVVRSGAATSIFEVLTGKVRVTERLTDWTRTIALSPDGRLIALGGGTGLVSLRSTLTDKLVTEWRAANEAIGSLAFSPDGKSLVSTSGNTAVNWDLQPVIARKPGPSRSDDERHKLWDQLGSREAPRAAEAIAAFVDDGTSAAAFVAQRIKTVPVTTSEQIERWVADLDSERFAQREAATQALEGVGELAVSALRKAHQETKSAETRRRAARLLARVGGAPTNWLQTRRGLEAIELIGAHDTLEALAAELSDTALRAEAQAAAARLASRRVK